MKRALYDFLIFGGIFFIGVGLANEYSLELLWLSLLSGAVFAGVGAFWRWVRKRNKPKH